MIPLVTQKQKFTVFVGGIILAAFVAVATLSVGSYVERRSATDAKLASLAAGNRAILDGSQHSIECAIWLVLGAHPIMCEDVRMRIQALDPNTTYPPAFRPALAP